ncbi:MAG: hypothetical protein ACXAC7_06405 [Candidatus Hodarchaeales archaeon]
MFSPTARAKAKAIKEAKKIKNEDLLQELDHLTLEAVEALRNSNHERVLNVLTHLIEYDLALRRIISNQLSGNREMTVSDETLNKIIELQSYFNVMRNNLLMEIVSALLAGYDEVVKNLTDGDSINYAMEWYKYAKSLNNYYLKGIKALSASPNIDDHQLKILQECMSSFEEVFNTANKSIRDLLGVQLKHLQAYR